MRLCGKGVAKKFHFVGKSKIPTIPVTNPRRKKFQSIVNDVTKGHTKQTASFPPVLDDSKTKLSVNRLFEYENVVIRLSIELPTVRQEDITKSKSLEMIVFLLSFERKDLLAKLSNGIFL